MAADAPVRRARRQGDRKRRGGITAFLLAGVIPAAAVGFFFLQPLERREAWLAKIPAGVGGRAISAGLAFGLLLLLARVALPAFFGASASLGGLLERMRNQPMGLRILLFPAYAIVWLGWFILQLLFALDAFLIVATALVALLLAVRIVMPTVLPGVLPELTR